MCFFFKRGGGKRVALLSAPSNDEKKTHVLTVLFFWCTKVEKMEKNKKQKGKVELKVVSV